MQGMSASSFLEAVFFLVNCFDRGLTGGLAVCLLPVTKPLPKVCLGISFDRDFAR
jgi:hypothetical protein